MRTHLRLNWKDKQSNDPFAFLITSFIIRDRTIDVQSIVSFHSLLQNSSEIIPRRVSEGPVWNS
ncbi:MAG TPA: hypothetical protein DIW81_27160 [Planctomycetaceae bacterium]|nr:hypothetical protein [Rubinisphaera sp.]HCS55221.1 hypothetical protein [Planctomycetaceae bacterium]